MPTCIEYMADRLKINGYVVHHQAKNDLVVAEHSAYTAERQQIWVFNVNAPIEPEDIRRCFDFKGHLLFIVDEKLIPDDVAQKEHTPMWLRVLHGLYLGRIYVWNGRGVYGVHFDYDTGDVSESGYIPVDDLRCQESGSWVKGWTSVYKLAFLHDRAWWKGNAESFHEAYARYKQDRERQERAGSKQAPPKQDESSFYGKPPAPPKSQPKADYYSQFLACRNATEAKALWKRLLIEHHPDKLGVDADAAAIEKATRITQEINQAYQKAEKVL